jgi:Zn-dependent protease with chaperone function
VAIFSVSDVLHPFDQAARRRLESMPELPALLPALPPVDPVDVPGLPSELRPMVGPICAAFAVAEPTTMHVETAELIGHLAPDEIEAVLAHECGHVLLDHVAYRTLLDDPAVPAPVRGALAAWARAAELSADRAAAAYQGGADAVTRVLFRLAGVASSGPAAGSAARAFAVRVREIQAWTATPAFARLRVLRHAPPGRASTAVRH